MANPPRARNSNSDTGEADRDRAPGTPRWVKVFGIIGLVVVLLFLILMFTRGPGGRHGPARHFSSGDAPATTAASGIVQGRTPPRAGHG